MPKDGGGTRSFHERNYLPLTLNTGRIDSIRFPRGSFQVAMYQVSPVNLTPCRSMSPMMPPTPSYAILLYNYFWKNETFSSSGSQHLV